MDPELSEADMEALNKLADDVEKLNQQWKMREESRRIEAASMDEKLDRMIALLEKMMPTPKSESEPKLCVPVETGMVDKSIDVTIKSDSAVATGVFDLCLDVSTIDSTQAEVISDYSSSMIALDSTGVVDEYPKEDHDSLQANTIVDQSVVVDSGETQVTFNPLSSKVSLDLVWNKFEVVKWMETQGFAKSVYAPSCYTSKCSPTVCENASINWPTHFTMHMDLSDRLKHILPAKKKVRVLKPPAKPPDCVLMCVLKLDGHEPFPGKYYFDAKYDIVKCIKTVRQEGLYVHIRFQHYLCEIFVSMMGAEKLFMTWGNSIIMTLIENCYTSTQWEIGALGKSQMHWAAKMVVGMDMQIPWILYKQEDLFGGGMVFTHDKALKLPVESSLVEEDKLELATLLIEKANANDISIFLPIDVLFADKFAAGSEAFIKKLTEANDKEVTTIIGEVKCRGVATTTMALGADLHISSLHMWAFLAGVLKYDIMTTYGEGAQQLLLDTHMHCWVSLHKPDEDEQMIENQNRSE